ncbi:MAG: arylsulfatase [Pirellulales bacterium]
MCAVEPATKPNVIVILADDVGYGDLSCYGATKIATPNLDKLAAQGVRFTDGHSPSATCTPTRYAMLTGQYAWRPTDRNTAILTGVAPLCIKTSQYTLPGMFQQAGYKTAAVGKWHLGFGEKQADYNAALKPGPLEIGFDYFFGVPATGDRTPCVYVENHKVVGLDPADPIKVSYGEKVGGEPTGKANPDLLTMHPSHGHDQTIVNGISRIGYMTGGKTARWKDEDMADTITGKAVAFIERSKDEPFFLYFATHDAHVPRVPHPRFAGKSGCGSRGDVVQELDWSVGQILAALDKNGLADNTIVVFSSDNGPVIDDGYKDGAVENLNGHKAAGPLRGGKYSRYEGGNRMPLILRWPARVKPAVSDKLVCQIDFLSSFAALVKQAIPADAAPDSLDTLSAFLNDDGAAGRASLVVHNPGLGIRQGQWKWIPNAGPNGPPGKAKGKPAEKSAVPPGELYDLSQDLGETKNLAAANPDKVAELDALLTKIKADGKSR